MGWTVATKLSLTSKQQQFWFTANSVDLTCQERLHRCPSIQFPVTAFVQSRDIRQFICSAQFYNTGSYALAYDVSRYFLDTDNTVLHPALEFRTGFGQRHDAVAHRDSNWLH